MFTAASATATTLVTYLLLNGVHARHFNPYAVMPCGVTQLGGGNNGKGTGKLFTVAGGGSGTYVNGSHQVINYHHPFKSPVEGILANVTIVDIDAAVPQLQYTPTNVTEVPVIFSIYENLNGSIGLNLPAWLPASSYVFRLTLLSRNKYCTIDTDTFVVANTSTFKVPTPCFSPGGFQCSSDNFGFQQCIQSDSSDTSFVYSDVELCADTTLCVQDDPVTISCEPVTTTTTTVGTTSSVSVGTTSSVSAGTTSNVSAGTTSSVSAGTTSSVPTTTSTTTTTPTVFTIPQTNTLCSDTTQTLCFNSTFVQYCIPGPESLKVLSDPIECDTTCDSTTGMCSLMSNGDECVLGDSRCIGDFNSQLCTLDSNGTAIWTAGALCNLGLTCNQNTGLCNSSCVEQSQKCYTPFSSSLFGECINLEDEIWTSTTFNCTVDHYCIQLTDTTVSCVEIFPDNTSAATTTVVVNGARRRRQEHRNVWW